MENGNPKMSKSVTFNPEPPQVVFVEAQQTPKPGSVLDRVQKYDRKMLQRTVQRQPRPPALPPRNAVQMTVTRTVTQKPSPPQPLPRAINSSLTVCRQQVRTYRRVCDTTQTSSGGPTRRCDVGALPGRVEVVPTLHQRMKVPDTPPPPPPSMSPADDMDAGEIIVQNEHQEPVEQSDGTEAVDDQGDNPGCGSGCLFFTVGCIGCIIG
ncbi:uncharacterized protein LOC111034619 [Myzus persicae]|uniref:uncharacterized protein LOC111034619 n=1 Tax=Myzus persicae TaxID=13164 RepID=UPI000B936AB2|nr:uncharacterized protein LOC111034619 [Myzus persicae]XP_022171602.1 uncharacterized protein LOC111034619 [Myzus persicae]